MKIRDVEAIVLESPVDPTGQLLAVWELLCPVKRSAASHLLLIFECLFHTEVFTVESCLDRSGLHRGHLCYFF